jgi:uncharacterized protein (TIGR03437 family)
VRLLFLALATVAAMAAAPPSLVSTALRFEPNLGQADPGAQFVARSSRYTVFLTPTGAVLAPNQSTDGVRIRFVDPNPAKLEGSNPLPGVVNYFLGSAPGLANIPTYQRVLERNLYPGIDAVYHGEAGQLEYDFIVAPGADPARIVLAFDGARSVQLNDGGEIELATAAGTLTQHRPVLWQERDGQRISIDGRYELHGNGQFALVVAKYDRARPLIIDPTLVFSTSIGGSGPNQVDGLAQDSQGNIYMAGQTASLNFPVVNGVQGQLGAAYAYRLNNGVTTLTRLNGIPNSITALAADPKSPTTVYAGTRNGLLKSTDSGGTWNTIGSGLPSGATIYPIVIDPSNSQVIYVVAANGPGVFKSTDSGATWTAINNGITNASFQYSGPALVIDPLQTEHLILRTDLGEFQTTDGGAHWSPYTFPYGAIAFDPSNKGVVYASSPVADIPTIYKSTDDGVTWNPISSTIAAAAFTLLVDPHNSSTLYAGSSPGLFKSTDSGVTWTLLSVPSSDVASQLIADSVQPNTLYVLFYNSLYETTDGGTTFSQLAPGLQILTFAVSSNSASIYLATQAANNVFVTKLDPTGQTILYSTYIGGSVSDQTADIAVDAQGNAYVTGTTQSPDFPVTAGALQTPSPGPGYIATAGFVLKLNPNGNQLIYSATISGVTPAAIAIDAEGDAYVAGSSQGGLAVTQGACWTTAPMCLATGLIGCLPQVDGFVFKLDPTGSSFTYATYLNEVTSADGLHGGGLALDSDGNAYVTGPAQFLDELSADGSSLLYSTRVAGIGRGIVLDSSNDAYVTGAGALVAKFDPNGAQLFSKTLGDVNRDSGQAIALDSAGNIVIAGNTSSTGFPLFSPLQGMFAQSTAFLTKLDSSASNLLFSTYVGDSQDFLLNGLVLDSSGRAIVSGSTFSNGTISQETFVDAFVSKYDMSDIPSVRLDNVVNAGSLQGVPVSPGEIITVEGAGFGTAANTQLLFDQTPALLLSVTANRLTAIVPYALAGTTVTQAQVQSGGALSNPMWIVVEPASPGIYAANGSGTGQALGFNQDGTANSISNPAAVGSTITFYATGVGQTIPPGIDGVLHRSAPAAPVDTVAIYIAGLYISGPQFNVGPAPGFPADVFTVQAVVPNPAEFNSGITLPGLVPVQIAVGGVPSQGQSYPYLGSSTVQIAVK